MSQTTFDHRVAKLSEKHRLLAEGVTYRIGPNGLIVALPQRRFTPRFPVKGVLFLLAAAFAFKTFLFMASGEAAYHARLAELAEGRQVERLMAWAMQPDPATRAAASAVTRIGEAVGAGLR